MVDKKLYLMIGIPAFLIGIIFVMIFSFNSAVIGGASNSESAKYDGIICLTVTRADGEVEDLGCKHNLIYNDGLEMFEESLAHGVNLSSRLIYLCNETGSALGCAAPVAAQSETFTNFIGCGLNSANGTYANNGASSGNWSIYATFTNSCAVSQDVNASRLGAAVSIGRNFSGATFSSVVTLAQNDQLTVNWTLMGSSG